MAETLALVGGRVLIADGTGVKALGKSTVVIADGRIVSVGGAAALPPDAKVIDLSGQTVLPGLIDAHVHLSSSGGGDLAASMQSLLEGGITTVRDLGAIGRRLPQIRDAAARGAKRAPRLVLCGQVISAVCPGAVAFPGMYRQVTGPDDARAAVNEQVEAGADVIKVMATGALTVADEEVQPAQLSYEEIAAIIAEGHRLGLLVASHAEGAEGIRLSVEAGADTIEHGEEGHLVPEVMETMAERGVILVPTLSVFDHVAESEVFPRWMRDRARHLCESARLTVEAARRLGIRIAMGADAPPQGGNAQELVRLADAGLTAGEAIGAATSVAAIACGVGHLVGTVEAGKMADLVVVDGDPLRDVRILANRGAVALVLQAGVIVAGHAAAAS